MNSRKFFVVMQGVGASAPDTTAPTVIISTESAGEDWPVDVTVTFSEEVTGFVVGDITAGNCTLANFATADNIVFTVEATPTARAVTLDIDAAVCQDLAGNDNEAATQFTFTSTWYPTDISTADADSLRTLYTLTDGANWTNKTNWGTGETAATWFGITVSGGRVTTIDLHANALNGSVSAWQMPTAIATLFLYSNANLSGDISSWVLPSSLVDFYVHATSVSGDISSWVLPSSLVDFRVHALSVSGDISSWVLPSSLVTFYVYSTSVSGDISSWVLPSSLVDFRVHITSVSGDISSWVLPSSLVNFRVYSTSVSGSPDCTGAVAMIDYRSYSCGLSQADVDATLWSLYQISRTASNGEINVAGTNAAPSGTFQAAASCPVTGSTPGKEIAHELLNDGCAAGINVWATVTITA